MASASQVKVALVVAGRNAVGKRIALIEDGVVVRVTVRVGMSVRVFFRLILVPPMTRGSRLRGAMTLVTLRILGIGARVSSVKTPTMVGMDFVDVSRRRPPKVVSITKSVRALDLEDDVRSRTLDQLGCDERISIVIQTPFELGRTGWSGQ